uniref:Amidohydrolase 2 n=1 Tax=Tanacetum cinerariifolium TaxID=118510 RepID=A0A699GJM5_TANCI|nr:amidohydrolase 2 [Tanacetum cinerariifolium]
MILGKQCSRKQESFEYQSVHVHEGMMKNLKSCHSYLGYQDFHSALFRVSRNPFPYEDLSPFLAQVVSSFGANHVMRGSDFPFVVEECGYKEAKEADSLIANRVPLSSSDLEWIMGKTAVQLFHG